MFEGRLTQMLGHTHTHTHTHTQRAYLNNFVILHHVFLLKLILVFLIFILNYTCNNISRISATQIDAQTAHEQSSEISEDGQ